MLDVRTRGGDRIVFSAQRLRPTLATCSRGPRPKGSGERRLTNVNAARLENLELALA